MHENEYKITIINKTDKTDDNAPQEQQAVAPNQSSDNTSTKPKGLSGKKVGMVAMAYALSVADRVVTSNINMVALKTGHEAYQQRLQYTYGLAKKGLSMASAIGIGAMTGGLPGAMLGAVASIGSEMVNYAIRVNEVAVAREQENTTQFLNQIRIGAGGGRQGRTE
jgi:hypothetical protein